MVLISVRLGPDGRGSKGAWDYHGRVDETMREEVRLTRFSHGAG